MIPSFATYDRAFEEQQASRQLLKKFMDRSIKTNRDWKYMCAVSNASSRQRQIYNAFQFEEYQTFKAKHTNQNHKTLTLKLLFMFRKKGPVLE